jgi:hypothetical protein
MQSVVDRIASIGEMIAVLVVLKVQFCIRSADAQAQFRKLIRQISLTI